MTSSIGNCLQAACHRYLVTLQRHANTRGYFAPFRFKGRIDKQTVHELALNPDNFTGRSDELILSTLVHEMAMSGRRPMESLHAVVITIGNGRGKCVRSACSQHRQGSREEWKPGQSMTHYILPEGRYAMAYAQLASSGYQLHWQSLPASGRKTITSKRKFTCPECGQNAWAKPGARLICG